MAVAMIEVDAGQANCLADGFREAIGDAGDTPNSVLLAAIAVILSDMLADEIEHLEAALQTIAGLVIHLRRQKKLGQSAEGELNSCATH